MTPRQEHILAAVVEAYAETAEPVGSLALSRRFGYSSATIRAEMAELENQGFITHPHTSAGRIPTDKGYRHYVNSLANNQLPGGERERAAIRRRITDITVAEDAVKEAATLAASRTGNLAIATLPSGYLYKVGFRDYLGHPEFSEQDASIRAASLVDQIDELLREPFFDQLGLQVLIGRENPIGRSSGMTFIVSSYRSPFSDTSYIGVLGPTRQDYRHVIGLVDYIGQTLEEELV